MWDIGFVPSRSSRRRLNIHTPSAFCGDFSPAWAIMLAPIHNRCTRGDPTGPLPTRIRWAKKATPMKIAVALLVFFASFAAYGQDLAGSYVLHGEMEVGSELLLKPDGKFEFMLAYGAADYWAKGTWKRDGNTVVLHTAGKKEEPFKLLRSEAGKPGQIRIFVMGQNNKGVENIEVHLMAGDKPIDGRTDSDGMAVFPDAAKAHGVAFEVPVYQVATAPYPIDATHKDYYFEINGDTITQVFFTDEPLAIDAGNLIMTHWGSDHPMRYEKEKQ
jgi:hypothetical protein